MYDLAAANSQLDLASASLGEAYEKLAVDAADRMEGELFMPVQKALGRCKRAAARFADRHGAEIPEIAPLSPGPPSTPVGEFIDRAATAAATADHHLADLQDSDHWITYGDAELRSELSEIRGLLGGVPHAAREFLRTLGR